MFSNRKFVTTVAHNALNTLISKFLRTRHLQFRWRRTGKCHESICLSAAFIPALWMRLLYNVVATTTEMVSYKLYPYKRWTRPGPAEREGGGSRWATLMLNRCEITRNTVVDIFRSAIMCVVWHRIIWCRHQSTAFRPLLNRRFPQKLIRRPFSRTD